MALGNLLVLLTVVAIVSAGYNEFKTENKTPKAVATKKMQRSGAAAPDAVRGSFDLLSNIMNRTDAKNNRRRGKLNLNKIRELSRKRLQNDDMLNDNEGAIATNQKVESENSTNSLENKMKILNKPEGLTYEATNRNNYAPQVIGVYCNFEKRNDSVDMCQWQWNSTVSSHGLGFKVTTASEVVTMNETTRGLKFSGPSADADGDQNGHFLYLAVDPSMENMVIKSPPFHGLWEFCKFEVKLHQGKMQNASIRLVSESTVSAVQWILQEVAGNNDKSWKPMRFMIGKVQQEVRIIIEVTRPTVVSLAQTLPYIAIDNIRLLECLPEPPVFNGECPNGQLKCKIMNKESCIKLQQICDLVRDCDDGIDENQNCDKMPYGAYCNFDTDNCGFENVPQPILKWSRHSGPTPTDKTGPNFDHTCGPATYHDNPVVPLSPAHLNHSLICIGFYFFVNMNVTGPNRERADFASTAVMKTVVFNPPPKVHGDINSRYYNCCMIRFYYQQNGKNYGSLSVDVVELTPRGNITTSLWFSTKDKGENWYRAAIFLPNITRRYFLLFKTRMGMRIYSDSAIDDFTMAPECFGLNVNATALGDYNYYDPIFDEKTTPHTDFVDATLYRFTTCGAVGRTGPTQSMCDAAYNNTTVSVTVLQSPPYQGMQVWEVPNEGLYTIIATGASGGLGSMWAGVSHGAQAKTLFELHRGEKLYMLIGQQGLNACKKTLSAQESQECSHRSNDSLQVYTSKTHEVRNTHVNDGGGGGGGGTYIFVLDKEGTRIPLLVGGGGGGLSVGVFRDDGSQHGRGRTNATPESGYMYGPPGRTSGAGGGWIQRPGPITPGFEDIRGGALINGGIGGLACLGEAHGGFGGGGGGCIRGGAGGGWLGGNTNEGEGLHGSGGWSYVDTTRAIKKFSDDGLALRIGPGEVLIIPAIHKCGCNYRCVALNEYRSEVKCYCPESWSTDDSDPTKCILEDAWPRQWLTLIVLLVILAACGVTIVLCSCLYLYNRYQKRKEAELHQKHIREQEVQLHRLRNPPGGSENLLEMAFNPHYGSESFLPQGFDVRGLPKVARESLKLVKALGQGAFGEVYQGIYTHRYGDSPVTPVAVKTLPEMSTGQSEQEFLMEAAIMAKFSHPNIVHLIGVCFDRHPRFIVLELLAGGDVKTFLRENRPKPERASALTMKDLILCSVDIAKGCRYLESKRFIHRDIAARNCLLTSRAPGRVAKIADFGMARDIYRAEYYRKGGKAMLPIKWMPPEAYVDGVFTGKTDIWSFGVLLWEVFALGVMPYTGCANREVMELVSGGGRLAKPYGCPQEIYRTMCDCWNPDPDSRPSFSMLFEKLQGFLQDPEILAAPLPIVRAYLIANPDSKSGSKQPISAGDYLVPKTVQDLGTPPGDRSTEPLVSPSTTPTPEDVTPKSVDSQFPLLSKASQDYGNIPMKSKDSASVGADSDSSVVLQMETRNKFLPSKSTDRLLSAVEGISVDDDIILETSSRPAIRETSFSERPKPKFSNEKKGPEASTSKTAAGRLIDVSSLASKLPANPVKQNKETVILDKTNNLAPERRAAPIASPDPPRVNAWNSKDSNAVSKVKPLCLDAAQLEENLNALKKNSGSVILTDLNAKNVLPPYINVVTNNNVASETKTIQIDPKKAVIHDLPEEVQKNESKIKQSSSAASLLNGPMTDVPYADSDNGSSSSGSTVQTSGNTSKYVKKQGSNGEAVDAEINC